MGLSRVDPEGNITSLLELEEEGEVIIRAFGGIKEGADITMSGRDETSPAPVKRRYVRAETGGLHRKAQEFLYHSLSTPDAVEEKAIKEV